MSGLYLANSRTIPTPDQVIKQCKYVLSLDDGDDTTPIPQFLINEITRFMSLNPNDDNFVIELEAGGGYGIATCVDDNCYCDIILPPCSRFNDGGKSIGLGDLDAYATHCLEYAHVTARDLRVKKKQEAERKRLVKLGKQPSYGSLQGQSKLVRQPSVTFPKTESKPKLETADPLAFSNSGSRPKLVSPLPRSPLTDFRKQVLPAPHSSIIAGSSKHPQAPADAVRNAWNNKVLKPLGEHVNSKSAFKDEGFKMEDAYPQALGLSMKRSNLQSPRSSQEEKKYVKKPKLNQSYKSGLISSDSEVEFISAKKSLIDTGRLALTAVKQEEDVVFTGEIMVPPKPEFSIVQQNVTPLVQPVYDFPTTFSNLSDSGYKTFSRERMLFHKLIFGRNGSCPTWARERFLHLNDNLALHHQGLPYSFHAPSLLMLLAMPELKSLWPGLEARYLAHRLATQNVPVNAVAGPSNSAGVSSQLSNAVNILGKPVTAAPGAVPTATDAYYARLALLIQQRRPGAIDSDWHAPEIAGESHGLGHFGAHIGMENPMFSRGGLYREPDEESLVGDELKKFFLEALTDFNDNVTVAESAEYLKLASLQDCLPGSTIRLMPHQLIGVAWMAKQERNDRVRGGLLCDSMGLGKTVQAIATCLINPSTDPHRKTTLIVAPLSLLPQWKAEIESKAPGAEVYIYHGANRESRHKRLRTFDYILISYGTLVTEYPQKDKKTRKIRAAERSDEENTEDQPTPQKRLHGPIALMKFHRIILDEAHTIRNKRTQASQACFELDGTYRWALSGTPVVNELQDCFALLHFCGISALADWENFRDSIVKPGARRPRLAIKRLQAVLKLYALRRHADSRIEDQPILQLPPLEVSMDSLDLDPDELAIYETIEKRARIRINKYIAEGSLIKNYQHVLVMLLRLRQVACHPLLIVRKLGDHGHADDLLLNMNDELFATSREEVKPEDVIAQATRIGGPALVRKLQEVLATRAEETDPANNVCAVCLDAYMDTVITACGHTFCKVCIMDVMTSPLRHAGAEPEVLHSETRPCPICRYALTIGHIFRAEPFEPVENPDSVKPEAEVDDLAESLSIVSKGKGRATSIDSADDDVIEEEDIPLSTKLRHMFELLDGWLQDDNTKCLVFSTFTSLLDLCSKAMSNRGISHEMYTGSMRTSDREAAIQNFKRPGRNAPRVCLISTKAGGVGLNLCEANKVIILDFSWTDAAERQALSRAHRIGQTKPVEVRRLCISNSVDERINALQEKKKALADGAFGEGGTGKIGRLTVNELVGLFGGNAAGQDVDEAA